MTTSIIQNKILAALTGRFSGLDVLEIQEQKPKADMELVQRSREGDPSAYQELVERYQKRVLSVALGIIGNPQDAEDIVQDAFLKAYRNLDSFKGNSSFYTWLYRIVFNLAIDLSRKAYRKHEFSSDDNQKLDALARTETSPDAYIGKIASPDKSYEAGEIRDAFQVALAELSDEHRAVIVLREIDGLSYAEISEVLECSKGTVMSRLHHARKKLQTVLEMYR